MMRITMLCVTAAIAGCGYVPEPAHAPANPGLPHQLTAWIDPASHLPPEQTMDACRAWQPLGVHCEFTSDRDWSRLTVSSQGGKCLPETPSYWTRDGELRFLYDCFHRGNERWEEKSFGAAARREFGRAMGMILPVPPRCVDENGEPLDPATVARHPNGRLLCGPSLLNNPPDEDLTWPTPVDALAFDLRDPIVSRLRPATAP